MAVVKKFSVEEQNSRIGHTECHGTIRAIEVDGEKFIQIDTYGSKEREFQNKLSQSLRLTEAAFNQLKKLGEEHF
ncbi:hypothetical protein [Novosphingobium sp.]|jgi:hypothetical protein|uniref:hypothetical protein n=1 Tax=Novosphingobium sp. TaxID=1874826 RepID=UPI0022CA81C6|nr:hypothetical protein [Novosphingobium sp.]MCZ8019739.1 hypothetical protein [Novosphingobium sp.]MCZ8035554.1 hypothetical protein [Novosphingobium sp.]MCZ8050868.1 hypothetical protein [Novosphingobium sp.]MCZ8059214.1 hypothetical protein [Novosphingobium sp.]MCZ8232660.1 hypothetical protein [Novosphingobium sp.]